LYQRNSLNMIDLVTIIITDSIFGKDQ